MSACGFSQPCTQYTRNKVSCTQSNWSNASSSMTLGTYFSQSKVVFDICMSDQFYFVLFKLPFIQIRITMHSHSSSIRVEIYFINNCSPARYDHRLMSKAHLNDVVVFGYDFVQATQCLLINTSGWHWVIWQLTFSLIVHVVMGSQGWPLVTGLRACRPTFYYWNTRVSVKPITLTVSSRVHKKLLVRDSRGDNRDLQREGPWQDG